MHKTKSKKKKWSSYFLDLSCNLWNWGKKAYNFIIFWNQQTEQSVHSGAAFKTITVDKVTHFDLHIYKMIWMQALCTACWLIWLHSPFCTIGYMLKKKWLSNDCYDVQVVWQSQIKKVVSYGLATWLSQLNLTPTLHWLKPVTSVSSQAAGLAVTESSQEKQTWQQVPEITHYQKLRPPLLSSSLTTSRVNNVLPS